MNSKLIKDIEGIIKTNWDRATEQQRVRIKYIVYDLADLLEREDKDNDFGVETKHDNFNRQQFLLDCGLK